jgi:hypothetical protein
MHSVIGRREGHSHVLFMAMARDFAATVFLALAVVHTFSTRFFLNWSQRYAVGSRRRQVLYLLSEVELVFALWGLIYIIYLSIGFSPVVSTGFLRGLSFTEPAFVLAVMVISSTRPILHLAGQVVERLATALPLPRAMSNYVVTLSLGPLLGSLITEPAAMTVTALLILRGFFSKEVSMRFRYVTLAVLFVNISVGGTLTSFAAPPVLMVAARWQWDMAYMLTHFAGKAVCACVLSTVWAVWLLRQELRQLPKEVRPHEEPMGLGQAAGHAATLAFVVASAHHVILFIPALFLFALWYQFRGREPLRWKPAVLVALFLSGIVVLSPDQRWWLEPLLSHLETLTLYLSAIALTAITDNAALTFLGAQVPELSEASRYALVAGAVVGGGLTVIANAPNPVGFGILSPSFGQEGIRPTRLFVAALIPTALAAICFWFL